VNDRCDCWLCAGEDPAERDTYERNIAVHVQEHGWNVTALPEEHELPGWVYSIGMWHTLGTPEVSMFGMRVRDMHWWVNKVGALGRSLRPGELVHGVLDGHPLAVRPVDESWYLDLFCFAVDFYRRPWFPMVQLVWPDRHGVFPWEPGAGARCRVAQPSLWLPKPDHPPGVWTRVQEVVESPFPGADVDSLVLGSRSVIAGSAPVTGVVHTADGSWEFLGGAAAEEVGFVHLRHLVVGHPHIRDFADLPRGYVACLEEDGNWSRSPVS